MQLNKILVLSLVLCSHAFAADIQPSGTGDYTFKPSQPSLRFAPPKKIKLMNFKLSTNGFDALKQKAQSIHNAPALQARSLTATEIQ
ncbi:MAG: hypothetical protein ACRCXC_07910 [Legionella sp.]